MDTYRVTRDCRLASGDRYRAGDEATLTRAAAKYPLLRGWIEAAAPLPEGLPEATPEPPAEGTGDPRPSSRRRRGA